MQRIFKYGTIQNTSLTPDEEPKMLRYIFIIIIIQELYTFKVVRFWPTL